jgi:hypothetical protein
MTFMRVVEVTIVQIIDVAVVANGGVAAGRPMLVSMVRVSRCAAGGHGYHPFRAQDPRTPRYLIQLNGR